MQDAEFKLTDAYRCDCPGCGSAMRYDIRARGMLCDSCGQSRVVARLAKDNPEEAGDKINIVSFTCPSCGATLNTNGYEATAFCSYCGSDVVLTARLNQMSRPSMIAPFRVTREECEGIYRKHLEKTKFVPDELKKQETIDHFRPVYIPYWRYKLSANGKSTGQGKNHYYDSKYIYDDTYDYELNTQTEMLGALYDASSRFDDETAQLLNFRYLKQYVVPFHPAYLCGIYTETPDTDSKVFETGVEAQAQEEFNRTALKRTGSTSGFFEMPKASLEAEVILMPVWLLAHKKGERVLYTAINGISGNIVCELPVDRKRYSLLIAALFCVILVVLLLSTMLIILRPNILMGLSLLLAAMGLRDIVPHMDSIIASRVSETDPTRAMKKQHPEKDVPLDKKLYFLAKRLIAREKKIGKVISVIAIVVILLLSIAVASGLASPSGVLSSMISDNGVGAPAIVIAAGIILFRTRYTYRKNIKKDEPKVHINEWDRAILNLLRSVCIVGFITMVFHFPAISIWCYGFSIITMLLFCAAMLRFNRAQNEYVTRPVPLFGKENR